MYSRCGTFGHIVWEITIDAMTLEVLNSSNIW